MLGISIVMKEYIEVEKEYQKNNFELKTYLAIQKSAHIITKDLTFAVAKPLPAMHRIKGK